MVDAHRFRPIIRTLLTVVAIAFSFVVGSVTTVIHQSIFSVGGIPLPWGLVLGFALVVAWLVGLVLVGVSRWGLVVSSLAIVGMVYLFSQRGPGGSVLVPESWMGNAWIICVPLVCIVMMFWPRLPGRKNRTPRIGSGPSVPEQTTLNKERNSK